MTARTFIYKKGKTDIPLLDPDPTMSADEVRQMYAASGQYPGLTNAAVNYFDAGGKSVREYVPGGRVEFSESLGKKG